MDDFEEVRKSLPPIDLNDVKNINVSQPVSNESLVKNKEISAAH
jgi:hypothetical protein